MQHGNKDGSMMSFGKKTTKKVAYKSAKKARKSVGKATKKSAKKAAKKIQGKYYGWSSIWPQDYETWFATVRNPFGSSRDPWNPSGFRSSAEPLMLDFDYSQNRVSRYKGEEFGAAPFPNNSPLEWEDAIGLFVDEAKQYAPRSSQINTFWAYGPRKGGAGADLPREASKELFVLSDGIPVVDFSKPLIQVKIKVQEGRVGSSVVLAVPGEDTSGWSISSSRGYFALSSALVDPFERCETHLGYYRKGPIAVRAIRGDRFYGFTFEAFVNCKKGELRTHNFRWT